MAIPRLIWILWLQGWDAAPPIVRACYATWRLRNPGWHVVALTQDSLRDYISVVPPNSSDIPKAAYSDLVRVNLLSAFGGVWADATVYCVRPLDTWIDNVASSGFFAFRPASSRMISTWLLAAQPENYLLKVWAAQANRYWEGRSELEEYFWFHRLFANAHSDDERFRRLWAGVPHIPAKGPHFFVPQSERLSLPMQPAVRDRLLRAVDPVYKLSHRGPVEYPEGSIGHFLIRWAFAADRG